MNEIRDSRFEIRLAGFTLLEIMIALAILSLGLVSLFGAQGNSLRESGRAENLQTASMLARQKMTEKMIDLEKDIAKGSFPDDKNNDQGTFDKPFEQFRWEFVVKKVEIPVAQNAQDQQPQPGDTAANGEKSGANVNQAPANAQQNLAQMVTKKISESVREISVKVIWEELEEEQSLVVTTHIAKPL